VWCCCSRCATAPLALIELAAAARSGDPAVGGPPTVGAGLSTTARRVLDAFGSQLDRLPVGTRLALLVAAAEDTGELGVVLDAVQRMGLGLSDFEPAERARRRTNGPRGLPRTRWCGAGGWPPRRWVRVTPRSWTGRPVWRRRRRR
jgi:hypothetical protein